MTGLVLLRSCAGLAIVLLTPFGVGPALSDEPGTNTAPALTGVTFVAFDTETTGLKAAEGRILEIGAVKFRNLRILDRKSWLINPGILIPEESRRINGITPDMVSNSPPFAVVFPEFAAFTKGAVLLAHNAAFDRRFTAAELARHGLPPPDNLLLDTLPLFRVWFPGLRSYALESLTRSLCPAVEHAAEIGRTQRFHAALWDAECTAALFMKGQAKLPDGTTLTELTNATARVLTLKPSPPSRSGKKNHR